MKTEPLNRRAAALNLLVTLLLLLGILSGAYSVLRFGGRTMEVDAARMALSADGIIHTGRIANRYAYPHGVGYAAVLSVLGLVTGLEIQTLLWVAALLVFITLLAAFIAYRELLGGNATALAATLLLLLQPDFLFYIVRGSHEKFTWTFAVLMLFFLIRGQDQNRSNKQLLINILLFYVSFWGMVMSNAYFASTFLMAIIVGLVIGWLLVRFRFRGPQEQYLPEVWMKRLLWLTLSCFVVYFVFINYVYVSVQESISFYTAIFDRIGILVFGAAPVTAPSTFEYFASAWRSPGAYQLVTAIQWLSAVGGVVVWLVSLLYIKRLTTKQRFLWQMYTGYGVILAAGTFIDFAGFLNENLQIRLFAPFAMFSAAMLVQGVHSTWRKWPRIFKRLLVPAAALLAALAFIGVQLKITNDPLIANNWLFYSPSEMRAGEWINASMQGQTVWVDTGDHLQNVFLFRAGYTEKQQNDFINCRLPDEFPNTLLSERVLLESSRKGLSVPLVDGQLQIYDNGAAQVYRRRPLTPYQR